MLFVFAAPLSHLSIKNRRRAICGLVTFAWLHALAPAGRATDVVDLHPATQAGGYRQAKVVVEVEGKLKLNADGEEVKHLPLKGKALGFVFYSYGARSDHSVAGDLIGGDMYARHQP